MNEKQPDMTSRIVLVTGATSGLGKVTSLELARMGARVVLAGRNKEKCVSVIGEISAETGNSSLDCIVADLSTLAGMRSLASQFLARHDQLHVLVNNAGAFLTKRGETADGFECTFALNHLAYFVVTNLLLDVLKKSAPSRIINVSSGIHFREKRMPLDDLQTARGYMGFKAYGRSKLANVLFTYELARRLEDTGVTANAANPGFTFTGLGMQADRGFGPVMKWMVSRMAKPVSEGTRTLIYLASSPEVEGVTGKYFENNQPVESSPASNDTDAARRLWEISNQLTSISD